MCFSADRAADRSQPSRPCSADCLDGGSALASEVETDGRRTVVRALEAEAEPGHLGCPAGRECASPIDGRAGDGLGAGVNTREIYLKRADGRVEVRLTRNAFGDNVPDWSWGP